MSAALLARSKPPTTSVDTLPENSSNKTSGSLANIIRNWPRHPGSHRLLRYEEINAATAAAHACDYWTYKKDPRVLRQYLKEWLGFSNPSPEEAQALWELVTEEQAKPLSLESWLRHPAATIAHLGAEIPRRVQERREEHQEADRPDWTKWNLRRKLTKNPDPEDLPPPPKCWRLRDRGVFYKPTRESRRFFREARRILPPRQFQVFILRYAGWEYKDIGKALGITPSAVRSHASEVRQNTELVELFNRWLGRL